MTKEKCAAITASARKQNCKYGDTKINFASFIPLQMTKFQKFWVPEYFLYQCTLVTFPLPVYHFWLLLLQLFLFLFISVTENCIFFMEIKLNWLDLAWLRYYYFHIKVFFCSSITLDDHLAINSKRNLSYLCTMFPCGQSYANLC